MPQYDIKPQFTFFGFLPPGSDEEHLAIVLNNKNDIVKYCYCTSKYHEALTRYSETDVIKISKDSMSPYFHNSKITYIYISEKHIIDILLVTLELFLSTEEYEEKTPISNDIYVSIVSMINNSGNLSDRFKKELLKFLE
jgi:hypothetical protein